MQDRFRFRAWSNIEHKMYYDAEYTYDYMCGTPTIFADSFGVLIDNPEWVLEQCTGLKDKNGNMIYEGDIVGFHLYRPDGDWDGGQGKIVWHNAGWMIESLGDYIPLRTACVISAPQGIEITGNIHTATVKDGE